MKRAPFVFTLAAFVASALMTRARIAAQEKLAGVPLDSELPFVQGIQQDLPSRFATAADAERAGYFRFTNEDDTGAISYTNLQWTSADPQHPSELWYDVNGSLIGADFTVPYTKERPQLWSIDPRRWSPFSSPHIHYITKSADGTLVYGKHMHDADGFVRAGGSLDDPQAATLVKLGKVQSVDEVAKIFVFPALWDLGVWVKPNPNGAFADKNPNVHPSPNATSGEG